MRGMGITKEDVRGIFAEGKAIITKDHFVYAKKPDGWYHGSAYVNKDAIYPRPRLVKPLCGGIADYFADMDIEVIVGPTVGGVSLSQWTTDLYNRLVPEKDVLAVFADEEDVHEQIVVPARIISEEMKENLIVFPNSRNVSIQFRPGTLEIEYVVYDIKTGTRRILKRGYDQLVRGKRCLITEDIINSGATVMKVIEAILKAGGKVVGVGALCNRSGGKVTADSLRVAELFSLLDISMEMIPEADCPICKEKGPQSVRTDLGKGREFLQRIGMAA